ncbi:DEAD/DEAH box helicase protein, partial [human gut metagenome]
AYLTSLQHLLDFPRKKSGPPRILILTPTRELAMQVADHARELAKHTHLDIATNHRRRSLYEPRDR